LKEFCWLQYARKISSDLGRLEEFLLARRRLEKYSQIKKGLKEF
jgi:hypothetical protein